MDREDKFIKSVEDRKYTSVKRYLKDTNWDTYICNRLLYKSMINQDDKMFDMLLNNETILSKISIGVCTSIMMHKKRYQRERVDYSTYIRRIISKKADFVPSSNELLDIYLQVSRLGKLYSIRKKMLKR